MKDFDGIRAGEEGKINEKKRNLKKRKHDCFRSGVQTSVRYGSVNNDTAEIN